MTREATLAWLAALQRRFGDALCAPLKVEDGQLQADVARYDELARTELYDGASASAVARLAVYNRQYWSRLLRVWQNDLPLSAGLCGLFAFNQLAIRCLSAHPPEHHDLARVADGFAPFVESELAGEQLPLAEGPPLPRRALVEAARIDDAYRRVFFAPEQPAFRAERAADPAALMGIRLRFNPAFGMVEEHWPLVRLRTSLLGRQGERRVVLPPQLAAPLAWALFRTDKGVGQLPLTPLHARLLRLLEQHPLSEALGRLEGECPERARAELPGHAQKWLGQAISLGFFSDSQPD